MEAHGTTRIDPAAVCWRSSFTMSTYIERSPIITIWVAEASCFVHLIGHASWSAPPAPGLLAILVIGLSNLNMIIQDLRK